MIIYLPYFSISYKSKLQNVKHAIRLEVPLKYLACFLATTSTERTSMTKMLSYVTFHVLELFGVDVTNILIRF